SSSKNANAAGRNPANPLVVAIAFPRSSGTRRAAYRAAESGTVGPSGGRAVTPARRSHDPDRPHFHRAVLRGGTACRPGNSSILVGDVDQIITAELFLGLGERPVEHLRLPLDDAH